MIHHRSRPTSLQPLNKGGINRREMLSATALIALGLEGEKNKADTREPCAVSSTVVRVSPCDSDELLNNPGKGYLLYNMRTPIPGLWRIASAGYECLSWADLQPTAEEEFNWSMIDAPLEACRNHGIKLGFGVLCCNSGNNQPQDVPQWVFDAGAKYVKKKIWNYQTDLWYEKKIPVWDDPVFLKKLEKLATGLAARYDGHPYIEFVENRSYGNWGEWHQFNINTEPPPRSVMRRMVDIYANHFRKTQLFIPCNCFYPSDWPERFARYAVDQREYGLERLGLVTIPDCMYGVEYCYDKSPAKGEWQTSYRDYKVTDRWSDECIDQTFLIGKFSYYNLGYGGNDSELYLKEKANQIHYWANRMGYWFRLVEACFPADSCTSSRASIALKFRNDGVAPIYVRAFVKLALMDASYHVLDTAVLRGIDPFDWKPGKVISATSGFSFANNERGAKLALGLFTDPTLSEPDIRLGTAGRRVDGWLVLNDMIDSDKLVHFEDLPIMKPVRLGWFRNDDPPRRGNEVEEKIIHLDHLPRQGMSPIQQYGGIEWGRGWITSFNREFYANGVRFDGLTVDRTSCQFRLPPGRVLKSVKLAGGGTVELHSQGMPPRTFKPGRSLDEFKTGWLTPTPVISVYVTQPDGAGRVFFDDIVYGYPNKKEQG